MIEDLNDRVEIWTKTEGANAGGLGPDMVRTLVETRWGGLEPLSVFQQEKYQATGIGSPTHRLKFWTDGLAFAFKTTFFKIGTRTFEPVATLDFKRGAPFCMVPVQEITDHA